MGIKREPIDETEQNDLKKEVADKFKLERNIKVEPPDSGDENAGESVTVTPAGERNEVHCRAVFVRWAHGHVPTQYFEIYVAVHPISDVPVNCVPTQYLAPRYGNDSSAKQC